MAGDGAAGRAGAGVATPPPPRRAGVRAAGSSASWPRGAPHRRPRAPARQLLSHRAGPGGGAGPGLGGGAGLERAGLARGVCGGEVETRAGPWVCRPGVRGLPPPPAATPRSRRGACGRARVGVAASVTRLGLPLAPAL